VVARAAVLALTDIAPYAPGRVAHSQGSAKGAAGTQEPQPCSPRGVGHAEEGPTARRRGWDGVSSTRLLVMETIG
jgi:hypothetical protein